jgi:hypothetical protein
MRYLGHDLQDGVGARSHAEQVVQLTGHDLG